MEHINFEKFLFFLKCDLTGRKGWVEKCQSEKTQNEKQAEKIMIDKDSNSTKKVTLILTMNAIYFFE